MSVVISDVDGTLANCDHRLHYVNGGRKDWKRFFEEMDKDTLYFETDAILKALQAAGDTILIVSARPEDYRSVTETWLSDVGVRYTKLYMRKAGDFRADNVVKQEILDQIIAEWGRPLLVIDDRESVCKMWRDNGIFVARVNEVRESAKGVPNYYIMVGPSGAGKDTLIEYDPVLSKCFHVSSDKLREVICKDFKDQSKNTRVFEVAENMVREALLNGLDTVFNATNIRDADRKKAVSYAPPGTKIHYVVVDRPMRDKERDAGWRANVTGLIARHDNTFKSNLKNILRGDGLDVTVIDRRRS